ncbi:MAG: hypothetical protein NTZ87_00145 [Candidatus Nomurabacteria bacterium]|nr:hypothetical protein [Candidatus Nomurabacteria bacterium]
MSLEENPQKKLEKKVDAPRTEGLGDTEGSFVNDDGGLGSLPPLEDDGNEQDSIDRVRENPGNKQ